MTTGADDDGREDLHRDFDVFLAGIRTSLPGTQVLVAFLLVVPLQARFGETDDLERGVFLASFLSALLSVALLIAPSVHQRVRAPISGIERRSATHVAVAVWLSIVGTVFGVIALTGVSFLATSFVFDRWVAVTAAAIVGATLTGTWFVLPLRWSR